MDKKQADEAKAYYETAKYLELSRTAEERYGLSHDDFVRMYEQAQNEGMDFETWMSKPEAKAELSALRAQQGEQRTSVVETDGQSGLNIGGGERPVVETETTRPRTGTSQQPAQEKTSALEQKVDDLTKQFWASVKDRDQASRDYRDAQERGASQEELDRLKARYDELEKQKDSNLAEYRAAKAEQKVDDLTKQYWEGVKDRDQAGRDYREAQERGASQDELDRLKARYDELEKQKDNNLAEYRASKAEMQSAREAADAAKNELKDAREAADTSKQKQQTVEQQNQSQQGEQSRVESSKEEQVFDTTALREEIRNKLSEELRQRANEQSEQPISDTTTLQEAAKNVDDASAKAELASRDYLNALKTGDPEIISAYKERLQEANDEFLAAKREQEALNK